MYDYIRKENLMWEKERLVEAVCKTGKMQEKPKKEGNCCERLRIETSACFTDSRRSIIVYSCITNQSTLVPFEREVKFSRLLLTFLIN